MYNEGYFRVCLKGFYRGSGSGNVKRFTQFHCAIILGRTYISILKSGHLHVSHFFRERERQVLPQRNH